MNVYLKNINFIQINFSKLGLPKIDSMNSILPTNFFETYETYL